MHYVLTVSNSITFGRHLFPRSTIQSTIYGIAHTFVMSTSITNTAHSQMQVMLYRLMAMWTIEYENIRPGYAVHGTHVPDVYSATGFMDFISLGKFIECSHILTHKLYGKVPDHLWREQREMATVRWRFRKLLTRISTTHVVVINDKYYSPFLFYARVLAEFAASIHTYKEERSGISVPIPGCTPKYVSIKIKDMLKSNYPELIPYLTELVDEKFGTFYWTGPDVIIRARRDIGKKVPLALDFVDRKIHKLATIHKDKDGKMGAGGGSDPSPSINAVSRRKASEGKMFLIYETYRII